MILLIDNYDSFVFNLARYFERLGQPTRVVRNDSIDARQARSLRPRAIVLSPGPCAPQQAGCSLEVVRQLHGEFPILGVCLGHQVIAEAFGGQIVRAPEPVHGRAAEVLHDGSGLFADLPNPFRACRYHSLAVEEASLPECLKVTARTKDGVIMGLQHKTLPIFGLQFHPESVLTEGGFELLAGFLRLSGLKLPAAIPDIASERHEPESDQRLPESPVTF